MYAVEMLRISMLQIPMLRMLRIPMLQMLRIQLKFFQCIEDPATDQHQPRANYGASDAMADRWSEDSNASDVIG